jgi:cystathionine beta-lyase/cystathionine gamma-synthase
MPDVVNAEATRLAHDDLSGFAFAGGGGPIVPPIFQSSLFTFDSVASMEAVFAAERHQPIYSRGDNPTVMAFEAKLAALEGTERARGFASGMAAICSTVLAFLRAGDRMVCVRHCYPDAYRLFRRLLPRLGIDVTFVDGRDGDAVERALAGAKLLYLESPTSVVFEAHDVAALASLARSAGAISVIDNSWATPVFQKPHRLGVDLVVHSASKYISGHSDTVAGVVCGSGEHLDQINRLTYPFLGGKLAPFEAFLLLRGLRTLEVRLKRQEASALEVAHWLMSRAEVDRVNHPALQQARGLDGTTSLFSIEMAPSVDIARFCDSLRLFRLGVSWGGHESLVFPAAVGLRQAGEHNSLVDFGVSPRLVRLHVGLEAPADLVADLDRALAQAGG